MSPEPEFFEESLVNGGLVDEGQEVVHVFGVSRQTGIAAQRVSHEEALIEAVFVWGHAVGLVVGGEFEVADFALVVVSHHGAPLNRFADWSAEAIASVGVEVAGLALVD